MASEAVTKSKQYDNEVGVSWHAVFYDTDEVLPDIDSPYYSTEITPAMAEAKAREHGYDTFDIVRTTTEIKRYVVTTEVTE